MKKKLLSIVLTVIMASAALVGCGTKQSSSSGSKKEKPYNVNFMYMVPSTFEDQGKVEKAISNLALKQINMTVHLIPISWGSYQQQLQLMLSGNENLDVFPLLATLMSGYKASGFIVDMNKLIDKYGVNVKKQIGEQESKICNVNGFIYGVTTMREWANPAGFVLRKDIVDKCGIDVSKIKTFDDMTNVFATVKAKYPNMEMFTGTKGSDIANNGVFYDSLADNLGVLLDNGQTTTVSNLYESNEYAARVKLMHKWYQAGYVKKDLATSNDSGETLMRAGNAFSFYSLIKPNSKAEKDSQTGYDTVIVPMTTPLKMTTSIGSLSYAIANNSKDPEKAMKFLDWAYGSSEFNNLLNWGIEGQHYVYKDKKNNIIDFPKGVNIKNDKYHVDFGYAIPNQFIASIWTGNKPTLWDTMRKFNSDAEVSKAYGFYFDATSVTNEISALSSIQSKYVNALGSGSVDPDSTIAKFNKDLKAAGLDKVIAAKQDQLNKWLKKNNK